MSENFYRKWRPKSFEALAGQEHVATTLTNALASGRIAHAYLFAGPRGTGKTSTGRLLGKALNCKQRVNGEPCNTCESCVSYLAGRAMDLIELDAASNRGIDEIRSLRDKVAFAPSGEYKVYLIDEVHMLTEAAFNALLKTLEEPPPQVVFILATTETHKVPATIASRCQRFDFRRIPMSAGVKKLEYICAEEGITAEPAALELIARTATGSLRDAENLLDQLATSYGSDLTLDMVKLGLGLIGDARAGRLARLALSGDLGEGLSLIASVRDDGLDLRQFQKELVSELRALLMVKSGIPPEDSINADQRKEMHATVASVSTAQLLTALRAFGEADLKQDPNSTLPLDIALADTVLGGQPNGQPAAPTAETIAHPSPAPAAPTRPEPIRAATPPAPVEPPPSRIAEPPPANWAPQNMATSEPPSPSEPESPLPHPEAPPELVEGPVEGASAPVAGAPALAASQPAEQPSPTNGASIPADLTSIRPLMRPLYEKARSARPQLAAFLNSGCDIINVDDRKLVIAFKFGHIADRVAEKATLDVLQALVAELSGRDFVISCVIKDDVIDWKQRESASRSPLVRAAQEMGARVLSSEPEE